MMRKVYAANPVVIGSLFVLIAVMGLSSVEGLRCYRCGKFIVTSVTPCTNVTISSSHLKECPEDATHCSKHAGPGMVVYGCEKDCEERPQGAFETFCCSQDGCNEASTLRQFSYSSILTLGALTFSPCILRLRSYNE